MANEGIITLNDLQNKYKAAGVYTVYRDESASPNVTNTGPIRLVYGFSKYGIFNTPVYIEKGDFDTADRLFGKLDLAIERKGSFFHRALKVSLAEGPVLALNLLKLNNEVDIDTGIPTDNADQVTYKSFSVDVAAANGDITEKLYASFYDKERFWKPSKAYLLATRSIADSGKLFNLVNLSQTPISFITQKSQVRGYDISVKEWYAGETIPKFLKENDLIKDYFIDVIAVYGEFGPDKYQNLSVDPIYGKYFTPNGLKISEVNNFLSRAEIKVIDIFTGCLIPNFKDKNGVSQYIETIINGKTRTTGIMCAVDKKEFDKFEDDTNTNYLDLVGHRLLTESVTECDFLSYKKKIVQDYPYTNYTVNPKITFASAANLSVDSSVPTKLTVTITSSHALFDWAKKIALGDYFGGETTAAGTTFGITIANPVLEVTKVVVAAGSVVFDLSSPLKEGETLTSGSFVNLKAFTAVAETKATCAYTITKAGNTGDIITLKVFNGISTITLGAYTVQASDTIALDVAGLVSAVNALTGTHGYTAANASPVVTVTGPTGSFTIPNFEYVPSIVVTPIATENSTTAAGTVPALFSGGLGNAAGYKWEYRLYRFILDGTSSFYLADKKAAIWTQYANGALTNGDKITDGTDTFYLKFTEVRAMGGIDAANDFRLLLKIALYTDADLTTLATAGSGIAFGDSFDSSGFEVTDSTLLNFISLVGTINERLKVTSVISPNTIQLDIIDEANVKMGNYLVGYDTNDNAILTRILSIKRIKDGNGIPTNIEITTADKIKQYTTPLDAIEVERYQQLTAFFDTFDITVLGGFKLKPTHMPNSTNERMKEILSVMTDTNIYKALIDPEMIDFRYLVDTFNHGLETQSKRKIARLVRERSKCLGLLNAPSMQEFKDSTDPRFTETPSATDPLPVINVAYINKGANLDENPSFLYTLPEEEDGASYVGFFFPNLTVLDDSGDYVSCPPAAHVGNNFMKKYNGGNPFKPTAGPRRGILTGDGLVGVEYELDQTDRGELEEKGINPIMMKKDGTIMIMGNETAYKRFKSVLNQLNTRDLLVTIEIDHSDILSNYLFEYNDDSMRSEVFSLLDNYLGSLQNAYKAIVSYEIIFDKNNNPNFVLKENAAIVDVIVEPADVTKKFIQRITLRKGTSPSVGGFIAI